MSIPTVAVTCRAFDQNGNPVANGRFEALLSVTEQYNGFVVPERVEGFSDANGICILNLWPNELGVAGSSYRIRAWNPDTGKKFIDTTAVVPNSACLLEQIIVVAPYPTVDASEQALIAAQSALADVTAQALLAQAAATSAEDDAATAAIAADSAQASAVLAASNSRLSIGTVQTNEAGDPATATITGSAGSQMLNLGIPRGPTGAGGTIGCYLSALDTTDQSILVANTPQRLNINTLAESTRISLTDGGRVVFHEAGTYSLTFSVQVTNHQNNVINRAAFFLKYQGSYYPNSASYFEVPAYKNSQPGELVATVNFVASATGENDWVEVWWQGSSTQLKAETIESPNGIPAAPSVILTVTQVMYTQTADVTPELQALKDAAAADVDLAEGYAADALAYKNTAQAAATAAGASATAADLDAAATAADRVQTGLDKVATAADRVQTGLDKAATAADRVAVAADKIDVANDRYDAMVAADTATTQAGIATTQAGVAVTKAADAEVARAAAVVAQGLAEAAAASTDADVIATAADRVQTGLDADATAADRVQTGLDAVATAADRVQTGLDATATAADRVQTGLDAAATAADRVQTGIDAATATAQAELATEKAAEAVVSQGIAGSYATSAVDAANAAAQARNDAVAVVTGGTASLTASAGKLPIAGASAVLDETWTNPIPGVNAAALHRSPNAVTAMFVYDTSKDSDGGAWTEKCQHTSWYNEAINGKWLGAQASESAARYEGATVSSTELVTNGDFSSSAGWTLPATGTNSITGGAAVMSAAVGYLYRVGTSITAGKWYRVSWTVSGYSGTGTVRPYLQAAPVFGTTVSGNGTFTQYLLATATNTNTEIGLNFSTSFSGSVDNLSIREVTAQTTQTGDYFQLTTDGKFYRLNAGSGTTEVFRGNKRDFPRLAAIVAEASSVAIYDLTEPGRPMWMRFAQATGSLVVGSVSSVAAVNGSVAFATVPNGLRVANFIQDNGRAYHSVGFFGYGVVSQRNTNIQVQIATSPAIVNSSVNAVAMTVLPDAPVDPVTGLKVPTIAVATGGGVSVIKHNGTVVNSSDTSARANITISQSILWAWGLASGNAFYALNPGTLGASFALTAKNGPNAPDIGNYPNYGLIQTKRNEIVRRGSTAIVSKLLNNESSVGRGIGSVITNTYNTGHQPGDIRRTYLSDNVVESVSGPEFISDGTFDTGITGWYISAGTNSSLSWDSTNKRMDLVVTGSTGGSVHVGYQINGLTVGRRYRFTASAQKTRSSDSYFRWGPNPYTWDGANSQSSVISSGNFTAGAAFVDIVATASTMYVFLYQNDSGSTPLTVSFDDISFREVVYDRSYKNKAATITGTLTKSLVASAAQLVAYSGFSNSNYLREPYSADLDFSTGEWSVGAWVNVPVSPSTSSYPMGSELWTSPSYAPVVTPTTGTGFTTSSATTANQSVASVSGILDQYSVYEMTIVVAAISGRYDFGADVGAALYRTVLTTPGTYTIRCGSNGSNSASLFCRVAGATIDVTSVSVKKVLPTCIATRSFSSGASVFIGVNPAVGASMGGPAHTLTATAYDGTTTRTVTTTAAYNTATWAKAEACYTTDGTLAIRVNGVEVAATRGNPLLTLNNSNAVLTIGNSYNLDAPFPGSIALLKLSATVPTAEQSQWMYEQEKQMFREGAQVCLPDSGSIVDLTYDDATDKWIAISATNESEWSGLVRTSVTAVPAGSYSKAYATSGVQLLARTTTSPGVDITIPSYGLREELVRRAEAAARLNAQLATFDYVGGFTATTVTGNTAITSVASLTYPTSYIGARVSGSGIPANTTIVAVSGTTIYLSAAATASASNVQISFVDYVLPVGYEAKEVSLAGAAQREGSTAQFTRLFDGFKETIRFGTAPAYNALVQIQAVRSAA